MKITCVSTIFLGYRFSLGLIFDEHFCVQKRLGFVWLILKLYIDIVEFTM